MASIKEFYAGRSIFITGATGFIGKVLIEKLLRSCPKIDKIYILIRSKRGEIPEERINAITEIPLFEKLKKEYPDAIKNKLKLINGDVTELQLGISTSDANLLIENVSVIFHGAASVRFDDPLKYAILLNTRGTRELLNLALKMKKLDVLLHISTTYCNANHPVVEEQLYPPHADWKRSIEVVENIDEHYLEVLTAKYIDVLPNTYTFSKSLAEHCVYDLCTGKIPAVIVRPSIVLSTHSDPIPGWIDNYNGPVGLFVASGKGILRSCCSNPDLKVDYMAVDSCVRALIMASWAKCTSKDPEEKLDVSFYNSSNNGLYHITMKEFIEIGKEAVWEAPFSNILWFPGGGVTAYKFWHYLNKKPLLVKIQRRIYIAHIALDHFMSNYWTFPNDKCLALEKKLLPEEVAEFGYDRHNIKVPGYFFNCFKYGRRYLLKEDDSTLERAKINLYRMYVLDRVVRVAIAGLALWYFTFKIDLLGYLESKLVAFYKAILI
ncbi:hypothetical protein RI129_012902 [Pyrocoelia pectoralis]|uniref:Fatty acyl-CoA reductase n=1 Tax=Pyrocoelia pectoralis TaxID=417401 RepID=A0AAN7UZA8_9COLE